MPTSDSRLSFGDCFDLLDQALADPTGLRIKFADIGAAKHFQVRLHKARAIDRRDNKDTYEQGHPMHGRSSYDILRARIAPAGGQAHYLYIEKMLIDSLDVEKLSNVNGEEEPVSKPLAEAGASTMQRLRRF